MTDAQAVMAMYAGKVVVDATNSLWRWDRKRGQFMQCDPVLYGDVWWRSERPHKRYGPWETASIRDFGKLVTGPWSEVNVVDP